MPPSQRIINRTLSPLQTEERWWASQPLPPTSGLRPPYSSWRRNWHYSSGWPVKPQPSQINLFAGYVTCLARLACQRLSCVVSIPFVSEAQRHNLSEQRATKRPCCVDWTSVLKQMSARVRNYVDDSGKQLPALVFFSAHANEVVAFCHRRSTIMVIAAPLRERRVGAVGWGGRARAGGALFEMCFMPTLWPLLPPPPVRNIYIPLKLHVNRIRTWRLVKEFKHEFSQVILCVSKPSLCTRLWKIWNKCWI